jgi:hypothetical protein
MASKLITLLDQTVDPATINSPRSLEALKLLALEPKDLAPRTLKFFEEDLREYSAASLTFLCHRNQPLPSTSPSPNRKQPYLSSPSTPFPLFTSMLLPCYGFNLAAKHCSSSLRALTPCHIVYHPFIIPHSHLLFLPSIGRPTHPPIKSALFTEPSSAYN